MPFQHYRRASLPVPIPRKNSYSNLFDRTPEKSQQMCSDRLPSCMCSCKCGCASCSCSSSKSDDSPWSQYRVPLPETDRSNQTVLPPHPPVDITSGLQFTGGSLATSVPGLTPGTSYQSDDQLSLNLEAAAHDMPITDAAANGIFDDRMSTTNTNGDQHVEMARPDIEEAFDGDEQMVFLDSNTASPPRERPSPVPIDDNPYVHFMERTLQESDDEEPATLIMGEMELDHHEGMELSFSSLNATAGSPLESSHGSASSFVSSIMSSLCGRKDSNPGSASTFLNGVGSAFPNETCGDVERRTSSCGSNVGTALEI